MYKNGLIDMVLELVLLIGLPGSGKSTYARHNFSAYSTISRDSMPGKSRPTELRMVEENLSAEKSVVVADTNVTKKIRSELIQLGKRHNAKIIGIYLKVSVYRALDQNNARTNPVPKVAIFSANKRLEEPSEEEGFDKVLTIF